MIKYDYERAAKLIHACIKIKDTNDELIIDPMIYENGKYYMNINLNGCNCKFSCYKYC